MKYVPQEPPTDPRHIPEYLSGELRRLSASIANEDWIRPTFTNGWSHWVDTFGSPDWQRVEFRKTGAGGVEMRGLAYRAAGASATSPLTLPTGYRPPHSLAFASASSTAPSANAILVAATGVVTLNAAATYVYFENVRFDTES